MIFSNCAFFVLAGGLGSRLKDTIKGRQKVIAEINGTNILKFILDQLVQDGVTEIFLLTGYRSNQVKDSLRNYNKSINLIYSEEKKPLGTGGAVKLASYKTKKENLIVINGDTLIDFSRKIFINKVSQNKEAILSVLIDDVSRYGELKFNEKMEILKMYEKCGIERKGYINAGTYLFKRNNIINFEKDIFSLENDYIPWSIRNNLMQVVPLSFDFLDIGIPDDYEKAHHLLKNK